MRVKRNAVVHKHRADRPLSHEENAVSALSRPKCRLHDTEGVVKSSAQTAIKGKGGISAPSAFFYGKGGIGIVLFDGMLNGRNGCRCI